LRAVVADSYRAAGRPVRVDPRRLSRLTPAACFREFGRCNQDFRDRR
jgi:hypothetical protein